MQPIVGKGSELRGASVYIIPLDPHKNLQGRQDGYYFRGLIKKLPGAGGSCL
jgi:hypothetical protein